jgi:hypothetical protein
MTAGAAAADSTAGAEAAGRGATVSSLCGRRDARPAGLGRALAHRRRGARSDRGRLRLDRPHVGDGDALRHRVREIELRHPIGELARRHDVQQHDREHHRDPGKPAPQALAARSSAHGAQPVIHAS